MNYEQLYSMMDVLYKWMEAEKKKGSTPLLKAISGAYLDISILVTK